MSRRPEDKNVADALNIINKRLAELERASLELEKTSLVTEDDGYIKLAGGLYIQWGQHSVSASTETVTFPKAFPNACLNVIALPYDKDDTTAGAAPVISTLPTTTQVVFSTTTAWQTFFWQAIGY